MLMIGNPGPDLEVETFSRMAASSACSSARWPTETLRLVQAFQAGGLTACERQPGDGLLVAA